MSRLLCSTTKRVWFLELQERKEFCSLETLCLVLHPYRIQVKEAFWIEKEKSERHTREGWREVAMDRNFSKSKNSTSSIDEE